MLVSVLKPGTDSIGDIAGRIQTHINVAESFFNTRAHDAEFVKQLQKGIIPARLADDLKPDKVALYLYRSGELISWTDNYVIPTTASLQRKDGTNFVRLKNGWYVMFKASPAANALLVGLLPVKYEYPFENRFLRNEFVALYNVPDNVELTAEKLEGSIPVTNAKGETLFGLYMSAEKGVRKADMFLVLVHLVLLLLVFYYLLVMAGIMHKRVGFYPAFFALGVIMVLVRAAMVYWHIPGELYRLDVFNPMYYASSVMVPSMGDLALHILMVVTLVFYYAVHRPVHTGSRWGIAITAFWVFVFFAYTALVLWVFKTLVLDSVISFEVYNILTLGVYSLIGLVAYGLLIITHFIVAREAIMRIQLLQVPVLYTVGFCFVMLALFLVYPLGTSIYESVVFTALWAAAFFAFLFFYLHRNHDVELRSLILYISFYALLTTFLIENLYERKERDQREFFAAKLANERDYVAEYIFGDIAARVKEDAFIRNFFSSPFTSKKEVADRLGSLYISGYYSKYDMQLSAFDGNGNALKSDDSISIHSYQNILSGLKPESLHYVSDSTENYYYLSLIPFKEDTLAAGYLLIKLTPKTYYGQNVYPELLLGNNLTSAGNIYNYSYAIYHDDVLVAQSGEYPYTYRWNSVYEFGDDDHRFIEEPEWEHGIMKFKTGRKVIVTVAREPLFEPVATFSYIFSFLFILTAIVLIVAGIRSRLISGIGLWDDFALSFRTRINYSMLAMIIVSFIIIGIVTISFFRNQYNDFYSDKLLRKEKVVHSGLEYFIQQGGYDESGYNALMQSSVSYEIARLAHINTVDINLFDTRGDLVVASQPSIYDKGILSNKMNPSAYFQLVAGTESQVNRQESIGELHYLATYAPVRNHKGETIAFLGIPYFERSRDVNEEVSGFLVALMNVYVFLLICAAILAYFISNSITRPLTIISEKLRILNLNKKNEPIEWDSKDEIGVLIGEYNKMITELEKSAHKLARSERESAWREMAKQIAHEIKNPLTPMKLSIQYLQRAIDEGKPNVVELAKKVAKTLEEQIENLSSIASAFSSFAKMPKPENEVIDLNDVLRSVSELFNKDEQIQVTFTTDTGSALVFADKHQLVSVFNNLIKNAMQSIPDNRAGFVDVNVKEDDGLIQVTVSDNGLGIPSDNYDKVFVPNFTTKSSGTGLGLAISKRIIDGAGGRIWFESAENVGTTFYVRLHKASGLHKQDISGS